MISLMMQHSLKLSCCECDAKMSRNVVINCFTLTFFLSCFKTGKNRRMLLFRFCRSVVPRDPGKGWVTIYIVRIHNVHIYIWSKFLLYSFCTLMAHVQQPVTHGGEAANSGMNVWSPEFQVDILHFCSVSNEALLEWRMAPMGKHSDSLHAQHDHCFRKGQKTSEKISP